MTSTHPPHHLLKRKQRASLKEAIPEYYFRGDLAGWRRRTLIGALRLRKPLGDHTRAEAALIAAATEGALRVVEVGAFEGAASVAIRASMAYGGTLFVVDPYPPGRLGFSTTLITAKRLANRQRDIETRWVRMTSTDAVQLWRDDLDVVVIDGVHTLDAVLSDWAAWGSFVRPGGIVVARNDVVHNFANSSDERSAKLLAAASPRSGIWETDKFSDSLTAYRRVQ